MGYMYSDDRTDVKGVCRRPIANRPQVGNLPH